MKRVLDAIRLYRDGCPLFLVFPPIQEGDTLWSAVADLVASYAPAGALPGEGGSLWRALVRASTAPDTGDYLRVFDDLDVFERWVITHFAVGRTVEETARERARKRWMTASGRLKDTPQRVLDHVGPNPRKAMAVTRSAGVAADYGRAVLAGLCHLGLIQHIAGEGYVRR